MTPAEKLKWQKRVAISKLTGAITERQPEPLERDYIAAAAYVGAKPKDVIEWWKKRPRT